MDDIGEVNLAAPGVGVHSAWTGGGFRTLSGTSMAVPHVAGVAALYLEEAPNLSGPDLWRTLQTQALSLGDVRDFGSGLVQARGLAASGPTGPES
jgi:subtilisin family serine protease